MSFMIKKVAVLGAGVMGAKIAGHCVNAGIETLLYDLPSDGPDKSALVKQAIAGLNKMNPAPMGTAQAAAYIQPKNYDENLDDLRSCDLIIEAIAERMDWKESLYKRVTPFVNKTAIFASNTSGLSINALCAMLPEELHTRFCGVHFFNPPRYMHLAELIPAEKTSKELVDNLETWLTRRLGKGVVIAKDTPNFIANRIGVFSLLATMHHAEKLGLGLDEVDALTGPLLGRPSSATFRTMDVVGLDTMQHVVSTMQKELTNDPWHALFTLPSWLSKLIAGGHLGQKSGQGIYRKQGKVIEVFDIKSGEYRASNAQVSPDVKTIMSMQNPKERMQALVNSNDKQAQFLTACFCDLFHYSAYHLADIAHTVRDVDLAMRWGFGWQFGPFETWQYAGVTEMRDVIKRHAHVDANLPAWLTKHNAFYTEKGAYSPSDDSYLPRKDLPVYHRQIFKARLPEESQVKFAVVYENEGVKLSNFKDDIAILSFKSKANSIGQEVLIGMEEALNYAEQHSKGVIIHQTDAANFSAGADLKSVTAHIKAGKLEAIDDMITRFQHIMMRIKYSPIPVVAALRGRALGGGCELVLHCDAVVAAFESYPGLVEVGVGLIPAGGGCKEMALRAAHKAGEFELMPYIQAYFQQISTATVAGSAADALSKTYLREQDCWVMHSDEVLYAAFAKIQSMLATNYAPPLKTLFKVAGREGRARLETGLVNWLEGGFISQHDFTIAKHIANVICGGDVYQGQLVDEDWILQLEKEAFMTLVADPLTQARIAHLLETGKPLRN